MDMVPDPVPPGGGSNTGKIDKEGPRLKPAAPAAEAVGVELLDEVVVESFEPVEAVEVAGSPTSTRFGVSLDSALIVGFELVASEVEQVLEAVDLIITVRAGVETEVVEVEDVLAVTPGVVVIPPGGVVFTGETRTRRTLPSAETETSLTGTILAPGGTI